MCASSKYKSESKYPKSFNRWNPPQKEDYKKLGKMMGVNWIGKELPTGTHDLTDWKCSKCKHSFSDTWSRMAKRKLQKACPVCYPREKGVRNDWDYIVKKAEELNLIVFPKGNPPTCKENIKCECKKCGKIKYQRVNRLKVCYTCRKKPWHDWSKLTEKDFHEAAKEKKLEWIGKELTTQYEDTEFYCSECDTTFSWKYKLLKRAMHRKCCGQFDVVNGKKTSRMQREIAKTIGAELNIKVGGHYVDGFIEKENIVFEYDSWFWHSHKRLQDRRRNAAILSTGAKLLTIESSKIIPTNKQLEYALEQLRTTNRRHYKMRIKDWGKGDTAIEKGVATIN